MPSSSKAQNCSLASTCRRMQSFAVPCQAEEATIRCRAPQQPPTTEEIAMGAPPSERPLEDRLDSWKEIAAYLNRDVTTVQRWEKREAMPVHRHLHDRMGSVYASRSELDAWVRGRNLRGAQENENETPPALAPEQPLPVEPPPRPSAFSTRRKVLVLLAAAAATLAIGAVLWLQRTEYFWRNPIADARFQ